MFSKPLLEKIHSLTDQKDIFNQKIKFKDIIDPLDNSNLLFHARGKNDILELLEHDVDLQHRNIFGRNALWNYNFLLNKKIESEIIDTLIENGIDTSVTCHKGGNILSSLAFFKYPDLFVKHKEIFQQKDVFIHSFYSLAENKFQQAIEQLNTNQFNVRFSSYIDVDIKPGNDFGRLKDFLEKEEMDNILLTNAEQESRYIPVLEFIKSNFSEQIKFINFVYTDMENHKKKSIYSFDEYHHSLEKSQLVWNQRKNTQDNKISFLKIIK